MAYMQHGFQNNNNWHRCRAAMTIAGLNAVTVMPADEMCRNSGFGFAAFEQGCISEVFIGMTLNSGV
jgi:hypothetical protein